MQNLLNDKPEGAHKARERVKYFFKETFRPHSLEEYSLIFTRGLSVEEEGTVSRKLPWLYIRVFALNLILFSILVLTFTLARYSAGYMTAVLFGGLLFNIPLLIFFFELYPGRGISLLKLFAVLIIGGALSTAIILLGYQFVYSTDYEPNPWISTIWVGFWEEFIKGAVAIAIIAVLKNKNPFVCFLIGFAVGTGFSLTEDLGYIYSLSRSYGTSWLVLTSVGRGLSCVCSHAPWTAIICWAFAKFKKPFLNFRFYAVVLASMVLHYFADIPFFDVNLNILRGVTPGWAIEAVVVIAIFIIVFFMLKSSLRQEEKSSFPPVAPLKRSEKLSVSANLTAVLCAVAFCIFTLVGCIVPAGERVAYTKIYGEEDFLAVIQQDLPLKANLEREYVKDYENGDLTQFYSDGVLKGATQKVTEGEYDYYYVYSFEEETPSLASICVRVDGKFVYLRSLIIYEDFYFIKSYGVAVYDSVLDDYEESVEDEPEEDEEEPDEPGEDEPAEDEEGEEPVVVPEPVKTVYFFNFANLSCGYSVEEDCFIIYTEETVFEGLTAVIVLAALSGVALLGGATAFITLKIKSRRYKDD